MGRGRCFFFFSSSSSRKRVAQSAVFSKTKLLRPPRMHSGYECMHAQIACAKRRVQNDALQVRRRSGSTSSYSPPSPPEQLQTCSHSWRPCASDSRPCRRISVRLRARRTSLTCAHAADTEPMRTQPTLQKSRRITHTYAHTVLTPCATHGDPC